MANDSTLHSLSLFVNFIYWSQVTKQIFVANYWPEFCCDKKNLSCFNDSVTLPPWKTVCSPNDICTWSSGVTTPGASSRSDPQQWAAVIIQRSLNNFKYYLNFHSQLFSTWEQFHRIRNQCFVRSFKCQESQKKDYDSKLTIKTQKNEYMTRPFEKNNLTRNGHEL